ncbi:MAG TPA: hypothetical protein VFD92_24040 [Candidatus Binatia bacterium]|nr:hypothetical protein [Candidatus Binatia bacterium]
MGWKTSPHSGADSASTMPQVARASRTRATQRLAASASYATRAPGGGSQPRKRPSQPAWSKGFPSASQHGSSASHEAAAIAAGHSCNGIGLEEGESEQPTAMTAETRMPKA